MIQRSNWKLRRDHFNCRYNTKITDEDDFIFSISRKHILADNFTKLLTERGFICLPKLFIDSAGPKKIYIMAPAIVSYVKSF